ncbi:MAG: DEAD/DEAH box helicase [Parachlamydiaceae bacterium]
MADFTEFNLDEKLMRALEDLGFKTATPIQEKAIPVILNGSDLIASAQTGTGKTCAFILPILQAIVSEPPAKGIRPRALVLVPTRELAMQVSDEVRKLTKHTPFIKNVCIYGGVPYPIQKRMLSSRYDILVATPGRLIDQLNQRKVDLSAVKTLILDEADRMLDMGFIDAVEKIAFQCPKSRQTLMFSATIDRKILPISKKLQNNPVEVQVNPSFSTAENIEQKLYFVDNIDHKMQILEHLLQSSGMKQSIIFTSTKMQADNLSRELYQQGYPSGSLHGDMNQRQRTRTINDLRKGKIDHLVATDVAARGIDIADLSHVVNFDLPFHPEDFVHRVGRTGRAGAKGTAITFASHRDSLILSRISKLTGKQMETSVIPGLEPKSKPKGPAKPFNRRGDQKASRGRFSKFPPRSNHRSKKGLPKFSAS